MMTSYFNLLKYAATGIASPDMTYYDRMRASTLMGGVVQTLTGIPPLTFKADGSPLISWSMLGNGQQSGTPSPQSIIMPTFCGVRTANLFDTEGETNGKFLTSDGSEGSAAAYSYTAYIPVIGGEKYTISKTSTQNSTACHCWYDADKQFISSDIISQTTVTLTAPASAAFLRCSYRKATVPEIMLNLGSTALPYEPYGWAEKITCAGQTVPVHLGQTQTVRRVGKMRLGDLTWAETTVSDVVCFISTEQINRPYGYGRNSLLCDRYKPVNTRYSVAAENNTIGPYNNTNSNLIVVHDSRYETAAAWISENADTYLWYILAEPTTGIVNEPLAKIGDYADELHSEDAGVSIPTAKGQNTLTVETDLQPSEMSITGKIKPI